MERKNKWVAPGVSLDGRQVAFLCQLARYRVGAFRTQRHEARAEGEQYVLVQVRLSAKFLEQVVVGKLNQGETVIQAHLVITRPPFLPAVAQPGRERRRGKLFQLSEDVVRGQATFERAVGVLYIELIPSRAIMHGIEAGNSLQHEVSRNVVAPNRQAGCR